VIDDPEIFGLHEASIMKINIIQSRNLLKTILLLQPQIMQSSESDNISVD